MATMQEYWGTFTATKSQLQSMHSAQMVAYEGFRFNRSSSWMTSVLNTINGTVLSIIFGSSVAGTIAATLFSVTGELDDSGNTHNADICYYGSALINNIKSVLDSNNNYVAVKATVRYREFKDSSGRKVRFIVGNGLTQQANQSAYSINAVQLSNGTWLAQ